jgi:hypothetical protein
MLGEFFEVHVFYCSKEMVLLAITSRVVVQHLFLHIT